MAVDEGVFQQFRAVHWADVDFDLRFANFGASSFSIASGMSRYNLGISLAGDQTARLVLGNEIACYDGPTLLLSALTNNLQYFPGVDLTTYGYSTVAYVHPSLIHIHARPTRVEFDTPSGRIAVELSDPPYTYTYTSNHSTSYFDIHQFVPN